MIGIVKVTVHFNAEFCFWAVEVKDVRANWKLSTKVKSELVLPKERPNELFGN